MNGEYIQIGKEAILVGLKYSPWKSVRIASSPADIQTWILNTLWSGFISLRKSNVLIQCNETENNYRYQVDLEFFCSCNCMEQVLEKLIVVQLFNISPPSAGIRRFKLCSRQAAVSSVHHRHQNCSGLGFPSVRNGSKSSSLIEPVSKLSELLLITTCFSYHCITDGNDM